MKRPYQLLLIALLILGSSVSSMAQSTFAKEDSVYIFYFYGTLRNGQPVSNSFIYKNLSFLKDLTQIKDEDDFLCNIFKHGIIYMDNSDISIFKHKAQYSFADKKEQEAFSIKLLSQIVSINKTYKDFITPKFSNGKKIVISITKVGGEFWIDPIDTRFDNIYPASESFDLKKECYNLNYQYSPKFFDKIFGLNQKDYDAINVLLTPQKKR